MDHGGTNQQLSNSVELLQSNNLALNNMNNETCDQLETTITEWVKTNAYEIAVDGSKKLHVLSLEVEPVRCEFQTVTGSSGADVGTLAALACRDNATQEYCKHLFGVQNCKELCFIWQMSNEEDRFTLFEDYYGIRPSVTIPLEDGQLGSYSSMSGEVVPAYFYVRAVFNEELSVRRT